MSFNLKVEPCQANYFSSTTKDNQQTQDLFCLSEDQATLPENKQSMPILGRPDSKVQGKIVISMDRCVVNCLPKEEIDSILSRSNIAIYTVNYGIDLKNRQDPFKRNILGSFLSADSRFTKLLDYLVKTITVTSDFGYLLSSITDQKYVVLDSTTESISSEHDQVIFRMQIQMSSKVETYDRNYKKVFSIIAELGGYIKAMVILAFLYKPFLKRLYYIDIINSLYRVERNKPLTHVHIDEEQAEKIQRESIESIGERNDDSLVLKQRKNEVEDAINLKKHESIEKELNLPLKPETIEHNANRNSLEDGPSPKKKTALQYTWMDWITVICPCMKTKKHKLLERVV